MGIFQCLFHWTLVLKTIKEFLLSPTMFYIFSDVQFYWIWFVKSIQKNGPAENWTRNSSVQARYSTIGLRARNLILSQQSFLIFSIVKKISNFSTFSSTFLGCWNCEKPAGGFHRRYIRKYVKQSSVYSRLLSTNIFLGGNPSAGSPTDTLWRLNLPCLAKILHRNVSS